eukprot:CFRG5824T1
MDISQPTGSDQCVDMANSEKPADDDSAKPTPEKSEQSSACNEVVKRTITNSFENMRSMSLPNSMGVGTDMEMELDNTSATSTNDTKRPYSANSSVTTRDLDLPFDFELNEELFGSATDADSFASSNAHNNNDTHMQNVHANAHPKPGPSFTHSHSFPQHHSRSQSPSHPIATHSNSFSGLSTFSSGAQLVRSHGSAHTLTPGFHPSKINPSSVGSNPGYSNDLLIDTADALLERLINEAEQTEHKPTTVFGSYSKNGSTSHTNVFSNVEANHAMSASKHTQAHEGTSMAPSTYSQHQHGRTSNTETEYGHTDLYTNTDEDILSRFMNHDMMTNGDGKRNLQSSSATSLLSTSTPVLNTMQRQHALTSHQGYSSDLLFNSVSNSLSTSTHDLFKSSRTIGSSSTVGNGTGPYIDPLSSASQEYDVYALQSQPQPPLTYDPSAFASHTNMLKHQYNNSIGGGSASGSTTELRFDTDDELLDSCAMLIQQHENTKHSTFNSNTATNTPPTAHNNNMQQQAHPHRYALTQSSLVKDENMYDYSLHMANHIPLKHESNSVVRSLDSLKNMRKNEKHINNNSSNNGSGSSNHGNGMVDTSDSPMVTQGSIVMELCSPELWRRFKREDTEMIMSSKGRQMFPQLKVKVKGLEPRQLYAVWLHFSTEDEETQCWKWNADMGKWEIRDKTKKQMQMPAPTNSNVEVYNHPWVTAPGSKWMEDAISFDKLRLTNDPNNTTYVILSPFRRYVPVLYIIPVMIIEETQDLVMDGDVNFFRIELAQFISSSAYHNPKMACLKIETNPMAKSQRNRLKQPSPHSSNPNSPSVHLQQRRQQQQQAQHMGGSGLNANARANQRQQPHPTSSVIKAPGGRRSSLQHTFAAPINNSYQPSTPSIDSFGGT